MRLFNRNKHKHNFIPFKVMHMEKRYYDWRGKLLEGTEPVTDVYSKCQCGEAQIKEWQGVWTLEEVLK